MTLSQRAHLERKFAAADQKYRDTRDWVDMQDEKGTRTPTQLEKDYAYLEELKTKRDELELKLHFSR